MKNLNKYALINAMMLAGAIGFTACSSDNDPIEEQRNGNEEVVKTQFAINIPYAGKGNTRMTDDIVQGQNPAEFRGMQNIRLMPFITNGTTGVPENADINTTTVNGRTIILEDITKGGDDGLKDSQHANYKVYNNVGIPLETNAFLFYGEALTTATAPVTNGKLNTAPDFNAIEENLALGDISFSLQPIVESTNSDIVTAQSALENMLNTIAYATVNNKDNDNTSTTKWAETKDPTLKDLYGQFTSLQAGSAKSILLTVQDLYNKVAMTVEDEDTDVTAMKNAIKAAISINFTPSGDAPTAALKYKTDNSYPTDKGLPCGSVRVKWNEGTGFSYLTSATGNDNTDNSNPFNVSALSAYTYPSSLFYMTNTPIKTSIETQLDNYSDKEWGNATDTDKTTILGLYQNGGKITSETQSVALVNKINYAVARFDVKAQFTSSTVVDNQNNSVTLNDAGFPFTGVLIGGQKTVGWNFLPLASSSEFSIFDKTIPTDTNPNKANIGNGIIGENKTLVLATQPATIVHFALELTNNTGKAFDGIDGIVHNGATFYLIGQLKPDTEAGENKHTSVFEKDHFTTANVTISNLKKAYNCIPDLRTPRLELGLSVDLTWKKGLEQSVTIE